MNREERSLRRQAKRALHNINPDEEVYVPVAPKGDYYD